MKNKYKNEIKIKGLIQAWSCENNIFTAIHQKDYFEYKKNLQPNSYLDDLLNTAVNTAADLRYKYVALSTKFDVPNKTDTIENEIGRVIPISITKVSNKIIVESKFDLSDANTLFTSISAFSDKSHLTLTSASGLAVNDGCLINLPSGLKEERKITAISGSNITLDRDLSENPSTSTAENFKQMICRIHLIYGSTSTLSLNTGFGASIASLKTTKKSTQSIYTRHEIEFLGS